MLAVQPVVSTSSQALSAISPGAHHTGQHIGLNMMSETIYHMEAHGCVTKKLQEWGLNCRTVAQKCLYLTHRVPL